jgi:hypothetical protein
MKRKRINDLFYSLPIELQIYIFNLIPRTRNLKVIKLKIK